MLCPFSLIKDIWLNILGLILRKYSYIQIVEKNKITDSKNRDICKNLFKNLNILTFIPQYIFSLHTGCNILHIQTSMADIPDMAQTFIKQYKLCPHVIYQIGSYHIRIMVFNSLPTYIWDISCNVKEFKSLFKNLLYLKSFYMLEEYFQCNNT
jgi:hypothetical protein